MVSHTWSKEITNKGSSEKKITIFYTSVIMAALRFYSGPIVHRLNPLGLLATSAFIAVICLVFLSYSTSFAIVIAATFYALGKTFFWPTMLGVVSEQFYRGGALALNFTGVVGMMGVGVVTQEKVRIFGTYTSLDLEKLATAPEETAQIIANVQNEAKKSTLRTVAIFPALMFVFYLGLIFYFKARGGYKPVVLEEEPALVASNR